MSKLTARSLVVTLTVAVAVIACIDVQGACPTPQNTPVHAWAKNASVKYALSAAWNNYSGTPGAIVQAFAAWDQADTAGNPSGVIFSSSTTANSSFIVTLSTGILSGHPNTCAQTTWDYNSAGNITSATTTFYLGSTICWAPNGTTAFTSAIEKMMEHEVGHTQGLEDQLGTPCGAQTAGQSVMNGSCGANDSAGNEPIAVTNCDNQSVTGVSSPVSGGGGTGGLGGTGSPCSPGTEPICEAGIPVCTATGWQCSVGQGCYPPEPSPCCDDCHETCEAGGWTCIGSPITMDAFGEGFHFTDIANGVKFRVLPKGRLHQMSWPETAFQNGWLALDRDGDGKITSFQELFGANTSQPPSKDPNGFRALAVFDDPANGGNGNGAIDPGDSIYSHLQLWIDRNHNGISEPEELHGLAEMGIFRIDLKYSLSRYEDSNGNIFRYKATVSDKFGAVDPVCYDVFVTMK